MKTKKAGWVTVQEDRTLVVQEKTVSGVLVQRFLVNGKVIGYGLQGKRVQYRTLAGALEAGGKREIKAFIAAH